MEDYRGFKYWLVETSALGQKWWRIEYPGGHKTPPLPLKSEDSVKDAINKIIAQEPNFGGNR